MSGVQFDAAAIRELAKILRETDLTEIELVEKDSRIRVARQITVTQVAHLPAAGAAPAAAPAAAVAAAVPEAVSDAAHPGLITSPMVGVAYLSPEPGAAAFVTVGAKVSQGQTLMLIEAMKTFNQIRAPRAGTVTRILVEGGSPVEYGEPLMIIE
ncbi:acetyl-CoA carboxylase biotin carboxyl carrier protein [Falsiroseomonas tokyonensis]|uniref:Biotin carboxyl carrier protein of acetyl-CoA carboxylase n=1 Tax=Falsiroseomonas tokyonensis TaxID=430521 RepID=A0ABV7BVX2_9PROT|nr:acetyl-CoA carboxylase biotin carboxyl carrier protein [Falsiroseomonas tokyonensis]MBU8538609.1 acetyl-CoA carboxylase biotin carboxyl carrier protein [Falsiroseomonas tokyonensis]